jgi:hypothetical protein
MGDQKDKIVEQIKKEILEELKVWLHEEIKAGRIKPPSDKTTEGKKDNDPLRTKELETMDNRWNP